MSFYTYAFKKIECNGVTQYKRMEPSTTLFAYGTLRKGEGNANILHEQGVYKETVATVEPFLMVVSKFNVFPYLISPNMWPEKEDQSTYIIGDIYDVLPKGMLACDELEGHPEWYERQTTQVVNTKGRVYDAEVYVLTQDSWDRINRDSLHILDGNWLDREGLPDTYRAVMHY